MSIRKKARLEDIEAVLMDVDGVLTNGMIILGQGNTELKCFHVRDGMAITVARECGLKIGFVTSRTSEIVKRRGEELGVDYVFQGVQDKVSKIKEISDSENIPLDRLCFIGDDINDIVVLRRVGFSATVSDAPDEVKSSADYVSANKGGAEAVRDIIRHILTAQSKWSETINRMIEKWDKGFQENII